MKKIAVFTSGGDSPGMNACLRAVVRTGLHYGMEVVGIMRGYEGMIDGDFKPMTGTSVSNIIQLGGTILQSARSERFRTKEGRAAAYKQLKKNGIEGVVAIGGDGTFTGASVFLKEHDIPIVGCPGTIDNDLYGTDYTIGYDTAINTAMACIDNIKDTANAHNRLFFVEVMGRHSGYIALSSGIGSGAACIMIPETEITMEQLAEVIQKGYKRKKLFSLVIVAEGNKNGGAMEIAEKLKTKVDYESKVTIIGHLQRGGSPTAADRVLASQLGYGAVDGLLKGEKNVMVGFSNNQITYVPFKDAIEKKKDIDEHMLNVAKILAL